VKPVRTEYFLGMPSSKHNFKHKQRQIQDYDKNYHLKRVYQANERATKKRSGKVTAGHNALDWNWPLGCFYIPSLVAGQHRFLGVNMTLTPTTPVIPSVTTTAKIANVVVVICIYSKYIIFYLCVMRQIQKRLSENGVLM
jgi:hypothetical protein